MSAYLNYVGRCNTAFAQQILLLILLRAASLIFLLDVVATLRVGYYDSSGKLIINQAKVRRNYLA